MKKIRRYRLLGIFVIAVTVMVVGYCRWVLPMRRVNAYLQQQVVRLQKKQRKQMQSTQQVSALFDEKQEIKRWSSKAGVLLSWQVKQTASHRVIHFMWYGKYSAMLHLLKQWPSNLGMLSMHWVRGKNGGVRWSGQYRVLD